MFIPSVHRHHWSLFGTFSNVDALLPFHSEPLPLSWLQQDFLQEEAPPTGPCSSVDLWTVEGHGITDRPQVKGDKVTLSDYVREITIYFLSFE